MQKISDNLLGRGHTTGDAVIYFPSERVLHTGDLRVGSDAPFCDCKNGGSIKDWGQTLEKALQYDFDTVVSGHGPVAKREDLMKWVLTMATVRDRVRQACKADAATAADKLDFSGRAFQSNTLSQSGMPGMRAELAQ